MQPLAKRGKAKYGERLPPSPPHRALRSWSRHSSSRTLCIPASTGYSPLTLFVICLFVYGESPLFMWRLWPILLRGPKEDDEDDEEKDEDEDETAHTPES